LKGDKVTKKSVGNFTIEGDVVVGSNPKKRVQQRSGAEHRVRVTIRSTLAYDVIVESKLPDLKPPRALSYAQPAIDRWQAKWQCVSGSAPFDQRCPLDVHGPAAAGQRLWSHELRYRLANSTIGLSAGGLWVSKTAQPLPVDVTVIVV
jgi:hypothetical protein